MKILFPMVALATLLACGRKTPQVIEETPAVSASSEVEGFKLRPAAEKMIEVKTERIVANTPYRLSSSALAEDLDKVGIYRLRNGWYKWVPISVLKKDEKSIIFNCSELSIGDEVAVGGTALLHVTSMFIAEGEQ